ncbi:MAG TPA: ABC transporter permease [Vicinamibacterales bacterium]|jgi:predicted permease|nr:ABC transporter permease [Vicinamibacterales bacterium]
MSMPGEWFRRLVYLVRRRAMDDELRREMEAHRAQMADPGGFGNTLRLREEAQDAWGWRWLDDGAQDVRFALRTLRRTPGFTLTAIVTLALGIGVNSGMFSLVNSLLLRPLYARSDEVVSVYRRVTKAEDGPRGLSYPNYLDLRDGTTAVFASLAASSAWFAGVDAGEGARRTMVYAATADYFQIFGRPLALGRAFSAEESRPNAARRVAVLSYPLWERRGANPNVVGQTVSVDGEPFTVIGVTAKGFTGTSIPGPEVWLPLGTQGWLDARDAHNLDVIGRLRDGVAVQSVPPALATVARRLEQAFPSVNGGQSLEMEVPSRLLFMPGVGGSAFTALLSLMLMALPAIVLLVACLNLANLLLARGHVRRQELAIRGSLGGSRGRLTRQLLTEGVLLSVIGGAIGLWLSTWAIRATLAALRPVLPVGLTLPDLALDWRVLAGTMTFSLLASLVFGVWPAWALTGRAVVTDLKRQVGDGGREPGGIRVGNVLVVAQVALSLLLLASAGLFLTSARAAATVDPGFRLERGVLAEIDPSLAGYDDARARAFHLGLVDRIRALPGVEAATVASSFPFSSFGESRLVATVPGGADGVDAVFTVIGRDYARTLGLPTLAGRDFSDAELASGSADRVAIVDDALAQRLWPNQTAIGQTIQFLDAGAPDVKRPLRIVGLVPAVKHSLSTPRPFPHVYVPLGQSDSTEAMTLQVRVAATQNDRAMLTTIARTIRDADDRVPILGLETWRDRLDSGVEVSIFRAGARVCAVFGGIALLLAVIGVYGVKSYVVSRRTREFGIRIATGAHPHTLLWQVLWEGGRVTAVGIAIGLVLAVGAGQILQGLLYGVNSVEPVVLVIAPLVLLAASLLASLVPALRATRVNPIAALRAE